MYFYAAFLPRTCRLLWHMRLWVAARWLCTHFPKRCRQEESEAVQVWGHDGGFSSRQLEQEVCWQEPWHAFFSRDTYLQSRKVKNATYSIRAYKTYRRCLLGEVLFSHLAEQISVGLAWQYSLVHSGRQLSVSSGSITAQKHISNTEWEKKTWNSAFRISYLHLVLSCNKTWKSLISHYVWYHINDSDNFSPCSDKRYNYNLTVSRNLWIKFLQLINKIYHIGITPTITDRAWMCSTKYSGTALEYYSKKTECYFTLLLHFNTFTKEIL